MSKHLYLFILISTFCVLKGFGQAYPPVPVYYADSAWGDSATLYLSFIANDTGIITAQVQIQQGAGNTVYDSTYTLMPNADTVTTQLNIPPVLLPCTNYQLLLNMGNHLAQGNVYNPLLSFSTTCVAGIEALNEVECRIIAYAHSIEIKTDQGYAGSLVQIYDLTGKPLYTGALTQSTQQIPFNNAAGIYLLRISGNGQVLYTNRFAIF